jgi:hypothetical protein
MPGCKVSAKRLGHIRGNIDALRHNWKPLLRRGKETGKETGAAVGRLAIARDSKRWTRLTHAGLVPIAQQKMRRATTGSTFELVEEVDSACREHAEQRQTHCHCQIHHAS